MTCVWLALFVGQRLAILALLAWGLKHADLQVTSPLMATAFAFYVVDTFRVLVDRRRRS